MTARCSQEPVLIQFVDLDRIDPSTLSAMSIIAERVGRLPLLTVLTARPEFELPFAAEHLALQPLAPRDASALVRSLSAGSPLSDGMVAEIVSRTDGVPLFIEELTRRVADSGELASAPSGGVPVTLMSALTARLDRLGEACALATAASVIGREFARSLLAEVTEKPAADVARQLDHLRAAGLMEQTSDDGWRFRHALMQEAAYGLAPRKQRAVLHARAAAAIAAANPRLLETRPQIVARHWTLAGKAEAAVPLWLRAGAIALQRGALQEAAVNLQEGLGLIPDLPPERRDETELRLRMVLGKTQIAMFGHAAQGPAETFARARVLAEATGADDALVSILFVQWTRALVSAEFRRARGLAADLLRLGRSRGHRPTKVLGMYALGLTLIPLGPFGAARRLLEHCIALYDPAERDAYGGAMIGDPLLMMRSFLGYVLARLGRKAEARLLLDETIAAAERAGDAYAIVNTSWNRVYLARVDESAEAVLAWADRAAKVADECGALYFSAMAHAAQGWAMARMGDLREGLRRAREGADAYNATAGRLVLPENRTEEASILERLGETAAGLALVEQALAEAEATGGRWALPDAFLVKSRLLARAGQTVAAEAAARAAQAAADAIGQTVSTVMNDRNK